MTSAIRREQIAQRLQTAQAPLSATALAKEFAVSRQAVVGDIALLRASGHKIFATPRGYLMEKEQHPDEIVRTIACRHRMDLLAQELFTVVDLGGAVLDVIVEHPLYGQISGELQLFSRYDVQQFLNALEKQKATPLSQLTDGIHLHTISCKSEEIFERITQSLQQQGILLDK